MWSYSLDTIIPTCRDFEDKLINLVWKNRPAFGSLFSSTAPSTNVSDSDVNLNEKQQLEVTDKEVSELAEKKGKSKKRSCAIFSYWVSAKADVDAEKTASNRPIRLFGPVYGGFAAALSICEHAPHSETIHADITVHLVFLMSGINTMIEESVLDGTYNRWALCVTIPFLFCVSLVRYIRCWLVEEAVLISLASSSLRRLSPTSPSSSARSHSSMRTQSTTPPSLQCPTSSWILTCPTSPSNCRSTRRV